MSNHNQGSVSTSLSNTFLVRQFQVPNMSKFLKAGHSSTSDYQYTRRQLVCTYKIRKLMYFFEAI